MKKCKVIDCKNREFDCSRGRLYGIYGYCQLHTLDLLRLKDMDIKEKELEKELEEGK